MRNFIFCLYFLCRFSQSCSFLESENGANFVKKRLKKRLSPRRTTVCERRIAEILVFLVRDLPLSVQLAELFQGKGGSELGITSRGEESVS
jgi:hypothetical protein